MKKNLSINDQSNRFRNNLRHLRAAAKISQEEMASSIGISVRKYQRIENGEADPILSELVAISQLLKIEVSDLVDFDIEHVPGLRFLEDWPSSREVPGADEFIDYFKNDFKNKYLSRTNNLFLDELAQDSTFMTFPLALTASNFQHTIANAQTAKEIPGIRAGIKWPSGNMWRDRVGAVAMMNKLFSLDESIFIYEPLFSVGDRNYQVSHLVLFNKVNGQPFGLGLQFSVRPQNLNINE